MKEQEPNKSKPIYISCVEVTNFSCLRNKLKGSGLVVNILRR